MLRPSRREAPNPFDGVFPIAFPVPCHHVLFFNMLIVLVTTIPFLTPHLNVTFPCPLSSSPWPLWPCYNHPSAFSVGTNKCRVNNGGCSSLCLATPGSRQCACAEDQVLDTDGVTCLGTYEEVPGGGGRPGSSPHQEGADVSNQ